MAFITTTTTTTTAPAVTTHSMTTRPVHERKRTSPFEEQVESRPARPAHKRMRLTVRGSRSAPAAAAASVLQQPSLSPAPASGSASGSRDKGVRVVKVNFGPGSGSPEKSLYQRSGRRIGSPLKRTSSVETVEAGPDDGRLQAQTVEDENRGRKRRRAQSPDETGPISAIIEAFYQDANSAERDEEQGKAGNLPVSAEAVAPAQPTAAPIDAEYHARMRVLPHYYPLCDTVYGQSGVEPMYVYSPYLGLGRPSIFNELQHSSTPDEATTTRMCTRTAGRASPSLETPDGLTIEHPILATRPFDPDVDTFKRHTPLSTFHQVLAELAIREQRAEHHRRMCALPHYHPLGARDDPNPAYIYSPHFGTNAPSIFHERERPLKPYTRAFGYKNDWSAYHKAVHADAVLRAKEAKKARAESEERRLAIKRGQLKTKTKTSSSEKEKRASAAQKKRALVHTQQSLLAEYLGLEDEVEGLMSWKGKNDNAYKGF